MNNVLQIIDTLNAGGAERMALNLANGLSEKIKHSHLITTRQEGLLKASLNKDIGYLFLNKKSTLDFKSILRLNRYVSQNKIDVIHAHSTSFFLATIVKVLNPKIKLFWHDHYGNSEFLGKRPKRVLKFCSKYFNHIFCVNTELVNWNKKHLKCKNVSYLQNFAELLNSEKRITKLQGNDQKRILCLANLRPQKDYHNLLNAFSLVTKSFKDWTLHCVGKDFNDAYANSVYQLKDTLNLNENVFFYGSCEDVDYIINQCKIGVLSSKSEGLPLALLEYAKGGLAVVATDVGDCNKIIKNSNTGFLVEPNMPEGLSKSIEAYIINDELREKNSKALQIHVNKNFSKEAVLEILIGYYKK